MDTVSVRIGARTNVGSPSFIFNKLAQCGSSIQQKAESWNMAVLQPLAGSPGLSLAEIPT